MKEYIGDGAYAEVDQFGCVVLTAEDGIHATDTVVLEPEVLFAFLRFLGTAGLINVTPRTAPPRPVGRLGLEDEP
jgi:hypothetical protein